MGERVTDSYWFPGTDTGFEDDAAPAGFETDGSVITVTEPDGTVITVTEAEAEVITAHLDIRDPFVRQLAEALHK